MKNSSGPPSRIVTHHASKRGGKNIIKGVPNILLFGGIGGAGLVTLYILQQQGIIPPIFPSFGSATAADVNMVNTVLKLAEPIQFTGSYNAQTYYGIFQAQTGAKIAGGILSPAGTITASIPTAGWAAGNYIAVISDAPVNSLDGGGLGSPSATGVNGPVPITGSQVDDTLWQPTKYYTNNSFGGTQSQQNLALSHYGESISIA